MTEEQKKMLVAKIDAAANKDIPKSAWWHMRHRTYDDVGIAKGCDTDGDNGKAEV